MDLHQILHRRRGPQRNHLCQNLLATRLRCRFVGGQKSLFSIDNPMRSPLTQEWRYRTPVIGLQLFFLCKVYIRFVFTFVNNVIFYLNLIIYPSLNGTVGCMHNGGIRKQKRRLLLGYINLRYMMRWVARWCNA